MNKASFGNIAAAALSGALSLAITYLALRAGRTADSFCALGGSAWADSEAIVHGASNAFYRYNGLIAALGLGCGAWLSVLGAVFTVGIYATAVLTGAGVLYAAVLGGAAYGLIVVAYGLDLAVLASLSGVFSLSAALIWFLAQEHGAVRWLLPAGAVLYSVIVSGPLALLAVISAYAISGGFQGLSRKSLYALLALLLLPIFCYLLSWEAPALPKYPLGAHVVPDYGTSALAGSRFGPEPQVSLINRGYERFAFWPLSLLSLIVLVTAKPAVRLKALYYFALGLNACLVLDSMLVAPDYAQVMPLQTLRRMIHGWTYFPLMNVMSALAAALTVLYLTAATRVLPAAFLALALGALATSANFEGIARPVLLQSDNAVWREAELLSPDDYGNAKRFLLSPSFNVIKSTGLWSITKEVTERVVRLEKLNGETASLRASHNEEELENVLDADQSTRWSAKRGKQLGDEWVEVGLEHSLMITGLVLHADKFYTDFPRGLQIEAAEDCSVEPKKVLYSNRARPGAIRYNKDGYPYFLPAHQTEVRFEEPVTTGCILIKQIGQDNHYDWSLDAISIELLDRTQ